MAEKLLTTRQVQTAGEGDHSDGGGLLLRVRGSSASWVLRYTGPSGRRREMGLGPARRGNSKDTGESLTAARDAAAKARTQLQQGVDPIEARQELREAAKHAEAAAKVARKRQMLTLARAVRDYHERVIEPRLSAKHAAQRIASLENHVPPSLWHKPVADVQASDLPQDRDHGSESAGRRKQPHACEVRVRLHPSAQGAQKPAPARILPSAVGLPKAQVRDVLAQGRAPIPRLPFIPASTHFGSCNAANRNSRCCGRCWKHRARAF